MKCNTSTYNIENILLFTYMCLWIDIKVRNKLPMMALLVPKSYNNYNDYLSYIHVNFKNKYYT